MHYQCKTFSKSFSNSHRLILLFFFYFHNIHNNFRTVLSATSFIEYLLFSPAIRYSTADVHLARNALPVSQQLQRSLDYTRCRSTHDVLCRSN